MCWSPSRYFVGKTRLIDNMAIKVAWKSRKNVRVAIYRCGTIGLAIGQKCRRDLKNYCQITGLYDLIPARIENSSERLNLSRTLIKDPFPISSAPATLLWKPLPRARRPELLKKVYPCQEGYPCHERWKDLADPYVFDIAQKNQTMLLIPSGAIGGLDVIKSIDPRDISRITLTTRKPPSSLEQSDYLTKKKIISKQYQKETILFDGSVKESVRLFPRNINVAAALALASRAQNKIRIRIITTAPKFTLNSHEINVWGNSGI